MDAGNPLRATKQLSAAAQDPQILQLLRDNLDDGEYYEARKLLTPNNLYPLAVERIQNAPGWWNDDEAAVYDVILELSPGDRARLWNENQTLFGFMSAGEKASVQRMCTGTEADALDERMDRATSGLGTDDDAVADVTARAGEAAQRERVLAVALETGMMPDGSPVTPEVRAQLEAQQAQLGGVQRNLLTAQRGADGELQGDSFLGRLHGDVGDAEFQGFAGQMRVDPFERAKQQILDAVGFWNDDEASINDAFETLVGQLDLAEGEYAASLSPQERQARQQGSGRALRERLWNDPDVQAALAHLNREEQQDAAVHASADTYAIALHDLADAYYGMNTDEAKLLSVVTSMSAPDRERLLAERPRIWNVMMGRMTPDEADMLRAAAETGRVPTDRALDVAIGGAWDGTDEDMVNQVLGAMSVEERATYRLGYYLQREGVAPEGPVEQDALRRFSDLEARLRGELGDDDLQAAMDKLVGVPGPEELQTDAGRAMSAAILRHRQADKLSVGSGLADAFTDTDETRDQAAVQFESAYAQAMEDGQLDSDEIAVLAHLDARFAERYADHVQTVDLIRNVASTVAAVAVGILVTVLTGGAAGPAVGGFLAQYGAAALAGGVAGAVAKVGTAEVMAGDHYDAMSSEGAADAAAGFADGATAVLSAGLAAPFTSFVGLSRGALAAEMTTATLRSASEATAYVGRRAASGAVSGALEGFLAGAVGEMVLTLSDEQTWKQSIWSVVGDAGLALLRGGLLGAATGGVVGGGAEGLSAVVEVRRMPRLVSQLEAAGIPRGEIDDMSIDVAQRVGRADELAQAGRLDDAAQHLDGLQGQVPPDRLAALRRAIVEPDQQAALAGHADRVTQLQQQGAFAQTTYHGTNSEMLDGLEQTQGRILSAEDLHQQSVTQRTGEGDAFSGASGRKQFISVGQGEAGLGTSLAYAEAGGRLNHYNVQRHTLQELDDEITRLQGVVDNFDDIDVQVGGPMAYYTKEKGQFESQLQKLLAERDLRMSLPATGRRRAEHPELPGVVRVRRDRAGRPRAARRAGRRHAGRRGDELLAHRPARVAGAGLRAPRPGRGRAGAAERHPGALELRGHRHRGAGRAAAAGHDRIDAPGHVQRSAAASGRLRAGAADVRRGGGQRADHRRRVPAAPHARAVRGSER